MANAHSRLRSPVSPRHFPFRCLCPPWREQHAVKPFSCCSYSVLEPVPSSAWRIAREDPNLESVSQHSFRTLTPSSRDYISKPCSYFSLPCFYLASWVETSKPSLGSQVRPALLVSLVHAVHRTAVLAASPHPGPIPRQPGPGFEPSRDSLP